jgi:hypothetical protein
MPGTFRYAMVTCGNCSAVAYYYRDIGVSAKQITLLAVSRCKACGQKIPEVVMCINPPPEGGTVIELPDGDSVWPDQEREMRL